MVFENAHHFHVENLHAVDIAHYPIYPPLSYVESDAAAFYHLQKAACLAAGHQSAERFDPPRCHPKTRVAVINDIMSWVNEDNPNKRIMWLNGPVGGGKSTIAQTVAERCHDENKLLSSFFFSRTATASGRDDGARLAPTIAYHLAVAFPEAKYVMTAELRRNPAILSYSMDVQMKTLVVEPLESTILARITSTTGMACTPQLVIIDGLDECNQTFLQSTILRMIARILAKPPVYLRFLIASRPEWEIRKTFNSPALNGINVRLTLDHSYKPDKDIEIYLWSEFTSTMQTHTLGKYLTNWPSSQDLEYLVERSSGQFIYASTVIKFVTNDHGNPGDRLQTILDVTAGVVTNRSPYAQLDALYIHILSTAAAAAEDGYNSISPILEVLLYSEDSYRLFLFKNGFNMNSVQTLAYFLGTSCAELRLSLVDLYSILYIPSSDTSNLEVRFFHASFSDFMKDSSRSREFFISEDKAQVSLGHRCFAILSNPISEIPADIQIYASHSYFFYLNESNFDDELLNELRSKNIKSFMHKILSGMCIESREFVMKRLFEYQVSTQDSCCFKIVPLSAKLRDMYYCILEAFDDLHDYSIHDVYRYIDDINEQKKTPSQYSQYKSYRLYNALKASLLENPERGKRKNLFLCNKTCRNLFHNLCRSMTSQAQLLPIHWDWDWVDIMKYLLGKIEPCRDFGKFLLEELPRITSFVTDKRLRSRGIKINPFRYSHSSALKNKTLIEFEEDVYIYLKKCDVFREAIPGLHNNND